MESIVPPSPLQRSPVVSYAGFWKRFVAYFIDKLLLSAVACIFLIPFFIVFGLSVANDMDYDHVSSVGFLIAMIGTYAIAIVLILLADWMYFAIMESKKGATLGKMALGIKVTDMNGGQISFGKATGRYFGKIVSGLILYIGFIMAGFTQQKQALHDIMAGTLVVNK